MSEPTIVERARSRPAETGETAAPSPAGRTTPADGPARADQAETPGAGGGLVRVTVNLTPAAAQAMERLCEETGYSKTDVINRALQVYEVWQEVAQRNGGTVSVKHQNGETERIRLL
ncbi:hypothetical protein ACNTMW_13185 [Planosporangium sp. 12N6]|uniref:hypothetical protein n=1 Tax=Planosporangium spinosum TaxID=3402278 RepID=UPI003CF29DFE